MKKAIFAGSFNPIHKGHIQIIKKASKLFDELVIVIANNDLKINVNNLNERKINVLESIKEINNVKVKIIENKLLATYAKENKINYLVRSARNNVDFDYELNMAKLNKELNSKLETILIIPEYEDINYSSTFIKLKKKIQN